MRTLLFMCWFLLGFTLAQITTPTLPVTTSALTTPALTISTTVPTTLPVTITSIPTTLPPTTLIPTTSVPITTNTPTLPVTTPQVTSTTVPSAPTLPVTTPTMPPTGPHTPTLLITSTPSVPITTSTSPTLPTTTVATPTTVITTTSATPTTTTTAAPTAATSQRVGTLNQTIKGDASQVPKPVVEGSVVLFSNENVTVSLPMHFETTTQIPVNSQVTTATVTFNVVYVQKDVEIAVILSDVDGTQAGNVTTKVSTTGSKQVDLKDLYNSIVSTYHTSFTIRAIRGDILKVSLGIITENVDVNIDPSVTSTIAVNTVTPTTTKKTSVLTQMSSASQLSLCTFLLLLFLL